MDNPKIRIESDGKTAEVYLNENKIRCTEIDFHGDVENGLRIKWDGVMNITDESGKTTIKNGEVVTEEFHYDSQEAVVD